jgi:1-acyl-sn-glycerol-3-phosphate acyltransferase
LEEYLMLADKVCFMVSKPVLTTYTNTLLNMDVLMHMPLPAGPKIIAANHPATTDPFYVATMLRQQSFILINNLLFQVPVLGTYLRASGHIPVKVGCGQEAIDTALEHLRNGHNIIIFPEGDLSPLEGGFQKPRTGVARLALLSGAPVIPVGVHLQRERVRLINSTVRGEVNIGRWYLSGPYHQTVGQALRFSGDVEDRDLVRSVAGRIMNRIIELSHESRNRMISRPGFLPGEQSLT